MTIDQAVLNMVDETSSESYIAGFQAAYNGEGYDPCEWDASDYEEGFEDGRRRVRG